MKQKVYRNTYLENHIYLMLYLSRFLVQNFPSCIHNFKCAMKVTQQLGVCNSWNLHSFVASASATKFSEAYTKQSQAQPHSNIICYCYCCCYCCFSWCCLFSRDCCVCVPTQVSRTPYIYFARFPSANSNVALK